MDPAARGVPEVMVTLSQAWAVLVKLVGADSQSQAPLGRWLVVPSSDWTPNCMMAVEAVETKPGMLMMLTLLLEGAVKRMASCPAEVVMESVPVVRKVHWLPK